MRQLLLVVLVLLVAATLRIAQLNTYPPGPHYDEAANVLITRSIAFDGADLFPIANSYQGRESLYFYLNAPLLRLIGDDTLVMRFSSVFANLLTIATAIALGRAMFPHHRGLVIGLIAGVLMTFSFHQILMSRQMFRAVTLPMMQGIALVFLWRGLKPGCYGWLVTGGILAGGTLYTYMASRLFPAWLLLAAVFLLGVDRSRWRLRLGQGVVFFGAMGLAALPMARYAIDNPDIFLNRLAEVTEGQMSVSLAESVKRHVEMFFIRGDFGNLRYNDPERPYFTLIEGLLLVVGWVLCLVRVLKGHAPTERTAYAMLLLSPLMVIPSVISVGGSPPSHMRSLGMVPLIFLVVAVGFEAILGALPYRAKRMTYAVIVLVLLIGSGFVARDYFQWARRADLFYQTDADLAKAVEWLPDHIEEGTPVYIGAYHRNHPTVLMGYEQSVTWLGTDSLILNQDGILIFAHDTLPREEWRSLLEPLSLADIPTGPDGDPAFWAYRPRADAALNDVEPPRDKVSNIYLSLIGIQAEPITAGATGYVTIAWQVQQSPLYSQLRPILSLQNDLGQTLSSNDMFLSNTDQWQLGETLIQRMAVNVPLAIPPGEYTLQLSWVDRLTGTFVSFVTADGSHAGISAAIGPIDVIRPETFPPVSDLNITNPTQVEVTDGVRLLGWDSIPDTMRPGEQFDVSLFWEALHGVRDLDVFDVMLIGDQIQTIATSRLEYAPQDWVDGELVRTDMRWQIPRQQSSGNYVLALRFGDQQVDLATFTIDGLPRLMEPPPVENSLEVVFGDVIRLNGYSLSVENGVNLDLVWLSLQPVKQDYTVFVHWLNADGQIVAQYDAMPNQYPTSLWLPGEYVMDRIVLDVVPTRLDSMKIGLYLQATGERLWVDDGSANDFVKIGLSEIKS